MFGELFEALSRPNVKQKPWMKSVELILGTDENLNQAIDECINAPGGVYGMDLETTGLDNRVFDGRTRDLIVGIGIAPTENKAYYFPVGHEEGSAHNISWRRIGEQFGRLLSKDTPSRPVFHNAGFDLEFLEFNGFFPLGEERWDNHAQWEDTFIITYLLNSRDKGGRGLKYLSKHRLDMEMIELDDLMPDSPVKDYSKLDPSWGPSVWYAAADPLCTLRLWNILWKEYQNTSGHTTFLYGMEKMCLTSVRWMHRCRVYIDPEKALKFARDGQREWFDSLLEVYSGASEILGRDVEPTYVKILKGEIKGRNKFDPNEVGKGLPNYKTRVDEARKESETVDNSTIELSMRKKGVVSKRLPSLLNPGVMEDVDFPMTYDVLSAQQLGLLFRELSVPDLKVTEKSGQVATSADILEEVIEKASENFPFMGRIKRFRELGKALSQYLIPFVEDVAEDGTLRPKFEQFAADTGRFSCKTTAEPWRVRDGGCRVPFQGIPATYDQSKPECINEMRGVICARDPKSWIVAVDYAGVELRLITNLSREPKWIREFFRCSDCNRTFPQEFDEQGFPRPTPSICPCGSDKIGDIHTLTAVAFYGEESRSKPEWKALRQNAKGCNFALCYGGTGRAVVRTINCTDKEGDDKYNTFIKTYRTLYGWWEGQHKYARSNVFVKTAFGRVLSMPDINNQDRKVRSKDERKSVNSPVQGTSADITKLAMSFIYKGVKKRGWLDKFKMILTIHDELVFEIHEDIIGEAIPFISETMSRNNAIKAQKWPVPILVDIEMGKDWTVPYDIKDLRKGYSVNKKKEKVYDLPESLVDIFKVDEEAMEEENVNANALPSEDGVYVLDKLNEEEVVKIADWIISARAIGGEFKIMYQGRDVTTLFTDI